MMNEKRFQSQIMPTVNLGRISAPHRPEVIEAIRWKQVLERSQLISSSLKQKSQKQRSVLDRFLIENHLGSSSLPGSYK